MSSTLSPTRRDPEHDAYTVLAVTASEENKLPDGTEPAWIDEQAMAPVQRLNHPVDSSGAKNRDGSSPSPLRSILLGLSFAAFASICLLWVVGYGPQVGGY